MRYSMTQLAQFVAVVEERSFTGAATKLRVAQPWLSTRVRQLEEQLGFRLLDRSPRGVSLTPAGDAFYKGAMALLREGHQLEALVAHIAQGAARTLQVGAIMETFYIPERNRLLESFQAANPDVKIHLENHQDPDLRRLLLRGALDAAFITGSPPAGLPSVCLRQGSVQLLMPSSHPLARHRAVPLSAVKGVRIGVFPRLRNPPVWDQSAGRLKAAGAQLEIWSETLPDALAAQSRSTGAVALGLSSFSDKTLEFPGMVVRPFAGDEIRADFFLTRREPGPGNDAVDGFWRFAQQFAASGT